MLENAGVAFSVVPADVDEASIKRSLAAGTAKPAAAVAGALARAKAEAVSTRHPHALVIGADQVLALDDELFDKPGDLAEARVQLDRLRGRTHRLISAVALAQGGEILWTHVGEAVLTMREFSPEFLERYLDFRPAPPCARSSAPMRSKASASSCSSASRATTSPSSACRLVPLLAELRSRGVIET